MFKQFGFDHRLMLISLFKSYIKTKNSDLYETYFDEIFQDVKKMISGELDHYNVSHVRYDAVIHIYDIVKHLNNKTFDNYEITMLKDDEFLKNALFVVEYNVEDEWKDLEDLSALQVGDKIKSFAGNIYTVEKNENGEVVAVTKIVIKDVGSFLTKGQYKIKK